LAVNLLLIHFLLQHLNPPESVVYRVWGDSFLRGERGKRKNPCPLTFSLSPSKFGKLAKAYGLRSPSVSVKSMVAGKMPTPQNLKNITYSRVIHLSHVIDTDIPHWQGDPPVEFETVAKLEKDGYYLRRFSLGEHSATHINAPIGFYNSGVAIDQYPAESLVLPAVVIDIREQVANNPDYALTVADILAWEEQHGEISTDNIVLLYTGWQEKWSDRTAFMNQDNQGSMHFPGFGSDATQFLLNKRQIAGVGIDTHGVDCGQDTTFATNRLVLEKPRIVLENLTNLDQLPPKGTTLAIGVLRLRGGSGSPAGVLALI
jgi:kynurenine formamidase